MIHHFPRHSVARLSGHTRDRRGCLTCRRRKKKCDGEEGRCVGCQRLNLHCEWEPERHVVSAVVPKSPTPLGAIVKAPDPLEFWLQATDNDASSAIWNRRMSLRYYVQSFASILSCNIENNGFLSGELNTKTTRDLILNRFAQFSCQWRWNHHHCSTP